MGDFLNERGYTSSFINWYLVPQVAAVWSASTADVLAFPAVTFIQFCVNHSLVQTMDRPQWRTVSRRSVEYVRRLAGSLPPARTTIKLSTPVTSVTRKQDNGKSKATVTDSHGGTAVFDHVIFGAHPDEVLAMLGRDASAAEKAALGGFRYGHNTSFLHTDDRLMPARKHTWASWNYMGKGAPGAAGTAQELTADAAEPCCVTYWLNRLQNLPGGQGEELSADSSVPQLFVTLNPAPSQLPAKDKIVETLSYSHPQYTLQSISAQKDIEKLQGSKNTWYCGAYLGYGFHEDGVTAGLRVANKITGQRPPWWDRPLHTVRAPLAEVAAAHGSAAATSPAPTPAQVQAAVQAKKAGGGPYWEDNLGNGGPVGVATREVMSFVSKVRKAQAEMLAARAGGVASIQADTLLGTTAQGDISGYLLQGPTDVLHTYRLMIGAGAESSAAARGSRRGSKDTRPSSPSSEDEPAVEGSSNNSEDSESTDSGGNPVTMTGTPNRARSKGKGGRNTRDPHAAGASAISVSSDAFPAPTAAVTSKSGFLQQLAKGKGGMAIQQASGGVDVTDSLAKLTGLSRSVLLSLQGRRAFKGSVVGDVLAARMRQAGSSAGLPKRSAAAPDVFVGRAVGELMALKSGGYTGQEPPLQMPEAYGTGFAWAWQTSKNMALMAAAGPVLSFLQRSIVDGFILCRTPDGVEHAFGTASAEYPLRVRLRVHSWNFFLRIACESDLGLARSFMAGEWSCDDLTALFNIFIQNRDNSKLSGYGLWTAWIGMTLNYLSFAVNMDNSVAGSRANISAHYDLSNDLFTSFLDPGTMMYSCGFFETSRRVLEDVEIVNTGATAYPSHDMQGTTHKGPQVSSTAVGGPGHVSACPATGPWRTTLVQAEQAVLNSVQLPQEPTSAACERANKAAAAAGKPVGSSTIPAVHKSVYSAPLSSAPSTAAQQRVELIFGGSLEQAQLRKLDHLIARSQAQKHHRVLDLGFGWGGLSIRLAETVGCRVHGITLSKEQHDLALERVKARGLDHLITFEIVDYRVHAERHAGEYDRIISVEMIEAVGHNYFPSYMSALDRLLAPNGIVVIQAITMPESRYREYIRTTDFINTIIFPGGKCSLRSFPSL